MPLLWRSSGEGARGAGVTPPISMLGARPVLPSALGAPVRAEGIDEHRVPKQASSSTRAGGTDEVWRA